MDNDEKTINKLIDDINTELNRYEIYNFYGIIKNTINSMATLYNLEDEEIEKQLELILKALKRY